LSSRADDAVPATQPTLETEPAIKMNDAEKGFQDILNNKVMVGHFTMDKRPASDSKAERYEISNVRKFDDGEMWAMNAKMSYGGKKEVTFPVVVPVKFAGTTPIIYLDNYFIPGLGTFSAKVIFDGNRYAGTWQHGEVGGHMFGILESAKDSATKDAPKEESKDSESK
jgi:hypothetical protein